MSEQSSKPAGFSNAEPTPWWRKAAGASLLVTAGGATLLGVLIYVLQSTVTVTSEVGHGTGEPIDAVHIVLKVGKPTIIEFGANNCVSCRDMKPILHALAQDTRIAVADIDILKERGYIGKYQIRLMPTQVFYNAQGFETGRHMGKISGPEILAHLGVANLDDSAMPLKP
jgi:thioredoxin 1